MGLDATDTMSERPGTQPSMDMKIVAVGPTYMYVRTRTSLANTTMEIASLYTKTNARRWMEMRIGRVQWGPLARGR